ncbi:MAG: hypothetical protein Q9173_003271 [Seirophora scorigena]
MSFKSRLVACSIYVLFLLVPLTSAFPASIDSLVLNPSNSAAIQAREETALSSLRPPGDFTFTVGGGSRHVHYKYCFAGIVRGLNEFAQRPFDALHPAPYDSLASNLRIIIRGPLAGGGFQARYGIWGLQIAANHMVETGGFRSFRFTLRWQGELVGTLWLVPAPPRGDVGNDGALRIGPNEGPNEALSTVALEEFDRGGANAAPIQIRITAQVGPAPALNDVLITVIAGLVQVARQEMHQLVASSYLRFTIPPYRALLRLGALGPASRRPPEWFTYDIVRQMLVWVADDVLKSQVTALQIMITQNGNEVGNGGVTLLG